MPKFRHDCDACRFLGTITGPNSFHRETPETVFDLYFCPSCDGGSVIARRSDEGSDYMSSPVELLRMTSHPALLWALSLVSAEAWWKAQGR